jgi:NAD(P)-dependent dehydrogenase (short-subunit alcohol dehydrogenase family)
MNLSGKVVLLTGAVGGIGSCTARRLIKEGARVALLDQNVVRLGDMTAEFGASSHAFPCDVSDEQSMSEAVQAVETQYGRIDIGVLNAGISGNRGALQDIEVAAFDRIMAVNARGVFLGLKHLFGVMQAQGGGSIVVTGSTESLRGNAGLAAYVASKHAVLGLVRTAALEWAKHNIRVNCVNPGPVDTEMMRAVERGMIETGASQVRERNTAKIPMQRYAKPEEVASFIAFLASEDSGYCTGSTFLLDGGILAGKLD